MSDESSKRLDHWKDRWDSNLIGFHRTVVHLKLEKYSNELFQEGEGKKFFVPLCGKTLDMKWLVDKGHTVVGLEGVKKAVEDFYTEQDLKWTEEAVPDMGPEGTVLKAKDVNLKLYNGDLFLFNKSLEGQFDCVWDRGSMVAVRRQDIKKYIELIKDILKPGGRILVEVMEYDVSIFPPEGMIPPPFPMPEAQVRSLYEPECTVEVLGRDTRILSGKEIGVCYYIIVKK